MMRLIVMTDVHANLPALEAVLTAIEQSGYDLFIHTGDAIGIGPFPAECLDRLLALPRGRLIMGNHDSWFAHGLPAVQPSWMSDGEWTHQQWTHAQLAPSLQATVATWPYVIQECIEEVSLTLLHYPLEQPDRFRPIMRKPTSAELDAAFAPYPGRLIFYGHHHPFADITGRARYINPGALGCSQAAIARYCQVELREGTWQITHCAIPYDDVPLAQAYHERAVPDRELISHVFHGGRFSGNR